MAVSPAPALRPRHDPTGPAVPRLVEGGIDVDYPLGGSICRLFNFDTPRHGLRCAEVASTGPLENIESLRSGRIDIGIVPIGAPGSRARASMDRVMAALGLTRRDFAGVRELSLAEQNRAFCAGELDAILYSVGHPNGLIRDATLSCREASRPMIPTSTVRRSSVVSTMAITASSGKYTASISWSAR